MKESRRAHLCAVWLILLGSVSGLTGALALSADRASAALAQDPPPTTTTTTPTTPLEPTPDPAPPAPPAKPKPAKPKPRPAPVPRQARPAPAPQPVSTPPVTRAQPSSPAKPRPRARPKPKKVRRKAPVERKVVVPKINVAQSTGLVSLRGAAQARPGQPVDIGSLLIVAGLGFAIVCFGIAMIPATAVPWRPAKIFVSERQVNLTVLGFALLLATAFTLYLTRGP